MKKVVILGGGTGQSTLLRGLKQFPVDISAVVSVCDDGKSTGNALSTYAGTENNTVESSSKKSGTPVYECDDIDSPFILGLIAPKIYVPSGMDAETLKSVCSHESAHLRRRDYIW